MTDFHFDYHKALPFLDQHEVDYLKEPVRLAHQQLHEGTGAGSDYLGWIDLPTNYDQEEFARIKKAAEQIRADSDALIVIGIGGSYLGARAAIEDQPFIMRETILVPRISHTCWNYWMAKIFQSMSFLNPERLRSRRLHFAFSVSYWRRNMAKTVHASVYMRRPTKPKVL